MMEILPCGIAVVTVVRNNWWRALGEARHNTEGFQGERRWDVCVCVWGGGGGTVSTTA